MEIHRRVLGHVDPIEGGEFRRTQVYVGGHGSSYCLIISNGLLYSTVLFFLVPPGPGDLSILMSRFEHWLNSDRSISMHPVK